MYTHYIESAQVVFSKPMSKLQCAPTKAILVDLDMFWLSKVT